MAENADKTGSKRDDPSQAEKSSPSGSASVSDAPPAPHHSPIHLPAAQPLASKSGVSPQDEGDPLIGKTINNRVKIIKSIARGGMGKVYLGEQTTLGRACAIKVLDIKVAASETEDFKTRFLLEASVTSKLTHPNAVTIFDYGETEDGFCYIAMEYLEGRTLAAELKIAGRLDPERSLSIARQVCRALREAHAHGVVHRDMKPGNIFLVKHDDEGDFAKVLDFGLVKETHHDGAPADAHTQMGQIMGSPRYMAPEQIQGKEVDGRTDIYSLGAVLFVMLTGRVPFDRANEMATMMAHVSEPVPAMGALVPDLILPRGLEALVMKCLAKDPSHRYASMEELLLAMKLPGGPGVPASTTSGAYMAVTTTSGTHPAVNLAAFASPLPEKKASPALFVIAILAALGAVAAIFLWMRSGGDARALGGAASVSTSAPAPPPAPPTVSTPPAPTPTLTLHVMTEPAGARVKEDGNVVCDATPCDIVYKGNDADAAIEHLLVFLKPDYKVERKIVKVTGEPFVVKMVKD